MSPHATGMFELHPSGMPCNHHSGMVGPCAHCADLKLTLAGFDGHTPNAACRTPNKQKYSTAISGVDGVYVIGGLPVYDVFGADPRRFLECLVHEDDEELVADAITNGFYYQLPGCVTFQGSYATTVKLYIEWHDGDGTIAVLRLTEEGYTRTPHGIWFENTTGGDFGDTLSNENAAEAGSNIILLDGAGTVKVELN